MKNLKNTSLTLILLTFISMFQLQPRAVCIEIHVQSFLQSSFSHIILGNTSYENITPRLPMAIVLYIVVTFIYINIIGFIVIKREIEEIKRRRQHEEKAKK